MTDDGSDMSLLCMVVLIFAVAWLPARAVRTCKTLFLSKQRIENELCTPPSGGPQWKITEVCDERTWIHALQLILRQPTFLFAEIMKKALLALLLFVILSLGWLSRGQTLDPALLAKAKQEYRAKGNKLLNKRYVTLVDYRQNIFQPRLYVYDMQQRKVVLTSRVAHAFNSGILYPTSFSNVVGSEQSCCGTFFTAETYQGKYGYSLRIDGTSPGNTNARARKVIIHSGYTWSAACFMTTPKINNRLINLIKGRSLFVVYN